MISDISSSARPAATARLPIELADLVAAPSAFERGDGHQADDHRRGDDLDEREAASISDCGFRIADSKRRMHIGCNPQSAIRNPQLIRLTHTFSPSS